MTRMQSALRSPALLASSIKIAFAEDPKHVYTRPDVGVAIAEIF
jgi:hypothetical protein